MRSTISSRIIDCRWRNIRTTYADRDNLLQSPFSVRRCASGSHTIKERKTFIMISFTDTIQFNDAFHCAQMIYNFIHAFLRRIRTTSAVITIIHLFAYFGKHTHHSHRKLYKYDKWYDFLGSLLFVDAAAVHRLCIADSCTDMRTEGMALCCVYVSRPATTGNFVFIQI